MGKFVLAPPDTVRVTVTARVPSGDGYVEQPFTAVIRKLYGEEKDEIIDGLSRLKDKEIIRRLLVDLPDFYDPSGELIPFDDTLIEHISRIDYVLSPLARECISVQDETVRRFLTEKN